MSTKTGKVSSATANVASSGGTATVTGSGPPPWSQVFTDPNATLLLLLIGAYAKGSDVEVTFDDTTVPPTPISVKAL